MMLRPVPDAAQMSHGNFLLAYSIGSSTLDLHLYVHPTGVNPHDKWSSLPKLAIFNGSSELPIQHRSLSLSQIIMVSQITMMVHHCCRLHVRDKRANITSIRHSQPVPFLKAQPFFFWSVVNALHVSPNKEEHCCHNEYEGEHQH